MRRHWPAWLHSLAILVVLVVMLFPVYWMFKTALESEDEIFHNPPFLVPPSPSFAALANTFSDVVPSLSHSLVIALGCVVVTLVIATPAGYALANLNLRGGALVLVALLLANMLPAVMYLLPIYLTLFHAHLLNSYPGLILADSTYVVPLAVFIIYSYMKSIPTSMLEAALIDGASLFSAFLRVVVPVAQPCLITSSIFAFLLGWGDFLYGLTLTNGNQIIPASVFVYDYISPGKTIQWSQVMSGAVYMALPVAVLLLVAQRYISAGLTAGAFKG
jgi:multiple sugar transport system permease protein